MDILEGIKQKEQISVGTRLGTMLLDHAIMTCFVMLFYMASMYLSNAEPIDNSNLLTTKILTGVAGYITLFAFSLYFCKDIINGRSISKRILQLQIVNNSTGQVADPIRCFIRNIFCILWPIEVIAGIANPNRRIGDYVAGTKLIKFDPSLEQPKLNIGKVVLAIALSYSLTLLLTLVII